MTKRVKKIFSITLKIAIVTFALWFIYRKVTMDDNLRQFVELVQANKDHVMLLTAFFLFALMFMNWGLEAVKWRRLIRPVEAISLWRAIESVFCGLTLAIFTPNRIGEYGGRVFFLSPKRRITGVVAMIVGNLAQILMTNVCGAVAISLFIFKFNLLDYQLSMAILFMAVVFSLFFIFFYFNIHWLQRILENFKWTARYHRFFQILGRYSKAELLRILLLCLGRFALFSLQYLIVFALFLPEIGHLQVLMMMFILFFVQSSLPSFDLLDVGMRNVTALFFFGYVTQQNAAVVACITSIWFINMIVPAILGSYFVFKLNIFGNSRS